MFYHTACNPISTHLATVGPSDSALLTLCALEMLISLYYYFHLTIFGDTRMYPISRLVQLKAITN